MTKTDYKGTYTIYPKQLSNGEESLYIAEIRSSTKGCSYGTQMLQEIFEYANKKNMSICLHANSEYFEEDGLTQQDLEDWYFRNGFNLYPDLDPDNSTNFFYKDSNII